MKRVNAIFDRDQECTDHSFRFTGEIPCTGPEVCTMCNARRGDWIIETPEGETIQCSNESAAWSVMHNITSLSVSAATSWGGYKLSEVK